MCKGPPVMVAVEAVPVEVVVESVAVSSVCVEAWESGGEIENNPRPVWLIFGVIADLGNVLRPALGVLSLCSL